MPALANDIENFKKHIDFEFYLDMSERTTDKVQKLGYGSKQETIVVELKQHQKTLRDFYDELDRLITVDQEAETEEILDWLSFIVNRMNELAAHMHTAADNLKPIIEKLRKLINGMENGVG